MSLFLVSTLHKCITNKSRVRTSSW